MSDQMAFVGRCTNCGRLHAGIVLTPQTADSVSRCVREWREQGLVIEQMTVEEARPQFALDCTTEVAQ